MRGQPSVLAPPFAPAQRCSRAVAARRCSTTVPARTARPVTVVGVSVGGGVFFLASPVATAADATDAGVAAAVAAWSRAARRHAARARLLKQVVYTLAGRKYPRGPAGRRRERVQQIPHAALRHGRGGDPRPPASYTFCGLVFLKKLIIYLNMNLS